MADNEPDADEEKEAGAAGEGKSCPADVEILYLNTDLLLRAEFDPTPLVGPLTSRGLFALHPAHQREGEQGWWVRFELDKDPSDPERTITLLLEAIESLAGGDRDLWWACPLRELDLGFECGDRPRCFHHRLSNDLLRRMAAAGATMKITIYPADDSRGP